MKKIILLVCVSLLMPNFTMAYTNNDKLVVSDVDKPIEWSLSALSGVLRDLLSHHCIVREPELYILSEFIYKQKPNATLREIKDSCEHNTSFQKVLFRYITKSKEDACPADGVQKTGFEQVSGTKVRKTSCQYYLERLVNAQNQYVNNYADVIDKKAGLYVKKYNGKYSEMYEIVDFVHSGNKTKDKSITIIESDNKTLKPFGLYMSDLVINGQESAPNFVNVSTSGQIRGIHEKSYIYKNIDLTEPVMKMCRQFGNPVFELYGDLYDFYPGHTFDVKNVFCREATERDKKFWGANVLKNLRVENQTSSECNVNGVVFDGQIVTLQWLGHFLYGCKETIADGDVGVNAKRYKKAAEVAQKITNFNVKGQAGDDGVFIGVQDIGREAGRNMLVFSSTQTTSADMAIKYVKNYMVNTHIVKNRNEISCTASECSKIVGHQDYIICHANNKVYQYEFDDICNTFGERNIPNEAK